MHLSGSTADFTLRQKKGKRVGLLFVRFSARGITGSLPLRSLARQQEVAWPSVSLSSTPPAAYVPSPATNRTPRRRWHRRPPGAPGWPEGNDGRLRPPLGVCPHLAILVVGVRRREWTRQQRDSGRGILGLDVTTGFSPHFQKRGHGLFHLMANLVNTTVLVRIQHVSIIYTSLIVGEP